MTQSVITMSPTTEIMRAVHILVSNDISGAPVIEDDKLVGIITERDCIAVTLDAGYLDEPGGLVSDYMITDLETVGPNEALFDVATRFRDSRFRRFPVVEDGRLVGIISRRDVLRALQSRVWFS